MKTQPKPLRWLGDSLDTVKAFSAEAKKSAGHQPFVKKTTKTGKQDIALATERYKALMKLRNAK
jgi:phage-related protein